jgi:hypothetical protein
MAGKPLVLASHITITPYNPSHRSQCTITITITITMDAAAPAASADAELDLGMSSSDDEQQTQPNSKRRKSANSTLYDLFTTEGVMVLGNITSTNTEEDYGISFPELYEIYK